MSSDCYRERKVYDPFLLIFLCRSRGSSPSTFWEIRKLFGLPNRFCTYAIQTFAGRVLVLGSFRKPLVPSCSAHILSSGTFYELRVTAGTQMASANTVLSSQRFGAVITRKTTTCNPENAIAATLEIRHVYPGDWLQNFVLDNLETCCGYVPNTSQIPSKHAAGTLQTLHEHPPNTCEYPQNILRVPLKHATNTLQTRCWYPPNTLWESP